MATQTGLGGRVKRKLLVALTQGVTLLGAFFGLLAIAWAPGDAYAACCAIIGASLCDMVDGRIARLLRTQSEFGGELDSLADVISFGVAPAFVVYVWAFEPAAPGRLDPTLLWVFAFTACAALRLARFNVSPGLASPYHIAGLSTPVAALVPTTMIMAWYEVDLRFVRSEWLFLGVLAALSGLMVSRYPFPSYKRFRSRGRQIAFYAAIVAGLTVLLAGGPGGSILLALLVVYFLAAALEGLQRWRQRGAA